MTADQRERRNERRLPVAWEAECRLGGNFVNGTVRDISHGGVFFAADSSMPGLSGLEVTDIVRFLEQGDSVLLTYTTRPFARARRRVATVRWVGHSAHHDCTGVGMTFDAG